MTKIFDSIYGKIFHYPHLEIKVFDAVGYDDDGKPVDYKLLGTKELKRANVLINHDNYYFIDKVHPHACQDVFFGPYRSLCLGDNYKDVDRLLERNSYECAYYLIQSILETANNFDGYMSWRYYADKDLNTYKCCEVCGHTLLLSDSLCANCYDKKRISKITGPNFSLKKCTECGSLLWRFQKCKRTRYCGQD